MSGRPYDHARNAGNRGDVWKHAVLLTVVDGLAGGDAPRRGVFRYLETHSGRGRYKLPAQGGWNEGVGRITGREPAHPYARLAVRHLQSGEYAGSWLLVRERLGELGRAAAVTLHDVSDEVARDVHDAIASEGLHDVTFCRGDGFAAVRDAAADLVLIDPPYVPEPLPDWKRVIEAMDALQTPALAWYPLLADVTFPPLDIALPTFSVWWDGQGSPFIGCGMVATRAAVGPILGALPELERVALQMGAACQVRVPP